MKRKSAFREILAWRFAKPSRIPPNSRLLSLKARRLRQQCSTLPGRTAFIFTLIGLSFAPFVSRSVVQEIGPIVLTVRDLNKELFFYTNTLTFSLISIAELNGPDQDALFGLKDVRLRVATLKLGDEQVSLTEHTAHRGKPIPADSRSFDHWFQHIAIVVSDMDKAYNRLRTCKAKFASSAPQTLPKWNKNAGGIRAFYLRDPEDHVLEMIWFPPGKGDSKWQGSRRREEEDSNDRDESASSRRRLRDSLFLGIDHTAIVVSDTDKSLTFYRDLLGLRVVGESENFGSEQEHLNQVFGARLRITALRTEHGPGIEFLEYITPPGGRPLPGDAKANDLVFWQTHLAIDDMAKLSAKLRESGAVFVSEPSSARSQIVRDPDGHAMQLDNVFAAASAVVGR